MADQNVDQVRAHTHDGIEEYDNRLPDWWLWILYGSIIFSVGYWLVFHTLGIADLPGAKYDKEMIAAAEEQLAKMAEGGTTDESLLLMAGLPDKVAEGRALFQKYCVVCHADQGQGNIGPNLTDKYWIHGATPMDNHRVVTNGVLDKGMAAWGRQLGPRRVDLVVAYVLTLRDTNVPGKGPEGEPYEGE
jgi:cytochrome c oxidase cbb3-type subunit 3